jgi:hypothetical protein
MQRQAEHAEVGAHEGRGACVKTAVLAMAGGHADTGAHAYAGLVQTEGLVQMQGLAQMQGHVQGCVQTQCWACKCRR